MAALGAGAPDVDAAAAPSAGGAADVPARSGEEGEPSAGQHEDGPGAQESGTAPLVVPDAVRVRLLALAADALGGLDPDEVPAPLRAVARFTPAKRARSGAGPLAAALGGDAAFRGAVAERLRAAQPDLAEALDRGGDLPPVPAEEVGAAAYLLRPAGWRRLLDRAGQDIAARAGAGASSASGEALRRLTEQIEAVRAQARSEAERLRAELAAARAEAAGLRRRVRELGDRAGRAEAAARTAERALEEEREQLRQEQRRAADQVRDAQARLADAESAAAAGRRAARERRHADEVRLRVLLDALVGAAAGLRRELALAPVEARPADEVAADYAAPVTAGPALQGRSPDDPALLDALLAVPSVHLLVDGYNVTKSGYGELSLETQRGRLLRGLGALAARSGAEVTVVFDGAERTGGAVPACPRGVRLLFSREGETADEVLARLVRQEPAGRPLVVVSSDREVARSALDAGARAAPSAALLRLLDRA